jgi:phosphate transport system substrate-binding protein
VIIRRAVLVLTAAVCSLTLSCLAVNKKPPAEGIAIQAAGSTFAAPLYQHWFDRYEQLHPEVVVDYEGVGSAAGIDMFLKGDVDIGASDATLSDEEVARAPRGVAMVPLTAGTVALAYNVPGVGEALRLSRATYVGIFLGRIREWGDSEIAAQNPHVSLPPTPIILVARHEGSGTTFAFTRHLSTISREWADGPGAGMDVQWPRATLKGHGNGGVAALVKRTPGAIGYMEEGFARKASLPIALLENKEGRYVGPTAESGRAALANAKLSAELRGSFPDLPGRFSYPIVTFTWLLLARHYDEPRKATAIKQLVHWCLTQGQEDSASLGYVPLGTEILQAAKRATDSVDP